MNGATRPLPADTSRILRSHLQILAPSANLQLSPVVWMSRMKGLQPMKTTLLIITAAAAFAAPPSYKVINKIKVGGGVRWDYAYLDSANHRLYVSHGTQTEVIDTATDKLVGTIPDTKGVHGVAVANQLRPGFTIDRRDHGLSDFQLQS